MAFNIVAGVNNAVYGSVSGSGSYEENAEVTLEVTANNGYRFVQWDDGNTDNPRVFNATEDVTVVATLEAIPEYAVTLTENNSNLGSTSGSGNYPEGSTATISATPALHCRFVKWDDDNTDNPRTLIVNSAITFQAIFETVNWYSIAATSADGTMGSVTGSGDYDEGDTVTLTAVPETDYKFIEWSDGNVSNPRTFTASQSLSLSATFAAIIYSDVTIASNDTELGTVSGATSGNIETGSSITLTATPATDCRFDGWQVDGEMLEDTSTTITLTVAENEMDIIAIFSAIVFYQINLLSSDTDCGHITVVSQTTEPRGVNNNIWAEGTILELAAVCEEGGNFLNWGDGDRETSKIITVSRNETVRANFYPSTGLILVTKKILNQTWTTIKNFFAAPTGASKIGAPANNALNATTLADVVNSVGQPDGIALLNASGKVAAADVDGTLANDTTGNAATATTASQLGTTTVGASDTPIYLNAGTATACGNSLAVDITGNAATAITAASCSGNAATATTATNANNVYLTRKIDSTLYPAVFATSPVASNGNQSLNIGSPTETSANCPIRFRAYCGAAGTQGNGTLALGNNLATSSANNARAGLLLYGTGTTYVYFQMGSTNSTSRTLTINSNLSADRTYTLPNGDGTIALTSSDITGNAATATTASACSGDCAGNAASATYSTNVRITPTDEDNGNYAILFINGKSSTKANTNYVARTAVNSETAGHCGLRVNPGADVAAGTQGTTSLILGNELATSSADNRRGALCLFGTGTRYVSFLMGSTNTSNRTCTINSNFTAARTYTLPDATGTIALTSSDITGNAASATYATYASVTQTSSDTAYDVILAAHDTSNTTSNDRTLRSAVNSKTATHSALRFKPGADASASGTTVDSEFIVGNNIANNDSTNYAKNRRGRFSMYGTGTTYLSMYVNPASSKTITLKTSGTTAREYTLPDKAGTFAMTSDIPSSASPGDYVVTLSKLCIKKTGSGSQYTNDYWYYNVFEYVYNSGFKDVIVLLAHDNITGATATTVAASTKLTITLPTAFTKNCYGFYNFRGGSIVGALFADYLLGNTYDNTAWGGSVSGAGYQSGFAKSTAWIQITLTAIKFGEASLVCNGLRVWGY